MELVLEMDLVAVDDRLALFVSRHQASEGAQVAMAIFDEDVAKVDRLHLSPLRYGLPSSRRGAVGFGARPDDEVETRVELAGRESCAALQRDIVRILSFWVLPGRPSIAGKSCELLFADIRERWLSPWLDVVANKVLVGLRVDSCQGIRRDPATAFRLQSRHGDLLGSLHHEPSKSMRVGRLHAAVVAASCWSRRHAGKCM